MRFIVNPHLNLLIIIILCNLISFGRGQEIDSVWFPSNSNNFTYCHQGQFNVSSITRYFDVTTSTYKLNFTSTTNMTVTNLNQQGSTSSASMMELRFGFETIQVPANQFCLDSINGCPISANQNFTIEKSFNLSNIPLYPLADITAQYSAMAANYTHLVCITLAPVGYQHPMWRKVFTWLPIGITISAAIISLIASFTIFHEASSERDIFLFSSNYAMLPGVLRLKTPGFFDLIFYSQFIVIAGQFNIDYPRFHALFTSNFSWSFLLFNESTWLNGIIKSIFTASSSPIESIASVPGYSIYKRQLIDNTTTTAADSSSSSTVNIAGTGMSDFATAVGIDINGLFFTLMIYLLLIIASCSILCFITWAVFYIIGNLTDHHQSTIKSQKMWDFTIGVLVRVLSLAYLPTLTMSFYQLMIPSFWYITLLAAVFLVTPFLFYGFVSIKLLQIRPASFIFTELKLLLRYGTLYNTFTDDTFSFYISILVYKSLIAAMIGLFQTSGITQIILVLLAESALMAGLLYRMPYADSQVNLVHIVFGFIRLTILALNITYLPNLQVTVMSKQYVGYVQMAFHCLAFFLFLVLQIKNVVTILTGLGDDELDESGKPPARMVMWRKRKHRNRPPRHLHVTSSATLMTTASGNRNRSHSATFYMGNNTSQRNSNRITDSQPLDMFTNYYGGAAAANSTTTTTTTNVAVLKPDEIIQHHKSSTEILAASSTTNENMLLQYPSLVADYRNITNNPINPTQEGDPSPSTATRVYKADDDTIPSSEPLMATLNQRSKASPPLPPLPKHLIFNNDSTYSPPHQPSPTSIIIQDEV